MLALHFTPSWWKIQTFFGNVPLPGFRQDTYQNYKERLDVYQAKEIIIETKGAMGQGGGNESKVQVFAILAILFFSIDKV